MTDTFFAGSWKYNTGRITTILNELTSSGISVQLKFLEEEASRDLVRYRIPLVQNCSKLQGLTFVICRLKSAARW